MLTKIETLPDWIIESIDRNADKFGYAKISAIAKELKIPSSRIEYFVEILEKQKIVELFYPANIFSSAKARLLKKEAEKKKSLHPKEAQVNIEYEVDSDGLVVKIRIIRIPSEDIPLYEVTLPDIPMGTIALLRSLMDELSKNLPFTTEEITDPKRLEEIRESFLERFRKSIKAVLLDARKEIISAMASILYHKMHGLGRVDILLSDTMLEEVAVNGSTQAIAVYHKGFGWLKTTEFIKSEDDIFNLAAQIGRKSDQQINSLNPIMDAHLLSGDRVAATMYPISTHGHTLTFRMFARNPWTISQFLKPDIHLVSSEVAAFMWLVMQYELNILVAGGTASGKTSMLNVLASFIPPFNRVISVEDTREIVLPNSLHWNWVPLTSKSPNPEGQGEVSMLDLIIASLRMRPDRIIVGEIRRKSQAQALFEAMHTGHSVYATIHANTSTQVKKRLIEPPIQVPKSEVGSLHLIIVQFRDRKTGMRRTLEVCEVIDGREGVDLNILYRWHPRTDKFEKINKSKRIFEDLSLLAGLTQKEIEDDLAEKELILNWMVEKQADHVDTVGALMRIYYKDKSILLESIKKGYDVNQTIKTFEGQHIEPERRHKESEEVHNWLDEKDEDSIKNIDDPSDW